MKTQGLHNHLVKWRHDLHMHPQISFEEEYASNKVANLYQIIINALAPPITCPLSITCNLLRSSSLDFDVKSTAC